jgi:hypothetical protein
MEADNMFSGRMLRLLLSVLMTALTLTTAYAAPQSNPLLGLVPPGSEIVAGIEDPATDHLLLVTTNNTLDFSDFLALVGVDEHRRINKMVEVAASSPIGELTERLLLAAGLFDRDHVFHAAMVNGATTTNFSGVNVLVVAPFAREKQQIQDTRWMAILDNWVLAFGTPVMVKTAIGRYQTRQRPDGVLAQRIAQLHGDVGSWNVLAMPAAVVARHVAPGQIEPFWMRLLEHGDVLTFGIRNGKKMRLYVSLETASGGEAAGVAESLRSPGVLRTDLNQGSGIRVESMSVEGNCVHAVLSASGKERYARLLPAAQPLIP